MKLLSSILPLAGLVAVEAAFQHSQVRIDTEPVEPSQLNGIPLLGFGTWNLNAPNTSDAVSWAIQAGYRHIDCATAYNNQYEVGLGIQDGLKKTGLKRENLWITSKLWNNA